MGVVLPEVDPQSDNYLSVRLHRRYLTQWHSQEKLRKEHDEIYSVIT